jgi:hypothetical protein
MRPEFLSPLNLFLKNFGINEKEKTMFLVIALVLVLAWIGGFVVFHTAGFLIHLLLIFAVVSLIMHFVRGTSAKA